MCCEASLRVITALATIFGLLTSCHSPMRKTVVDRSILTDDPCAAPCWQGIVPGQTTVDEAFDILTELGYRPQRCEVGNCIAWTSTTTSETMFGRAANLASASRTVDPVSFVSMGLESEISLGEVLDKYGPPDKYQAYETTFTLLAGGHARGVMLVLYYVQRGFILEAWMLVSEPSGKTVTADADVTLDWVHYFPPTTTERLSDGIPQLKRRFRWDGPLHDWQGLGPIEVRPLGFQ